MMSNKVHLLAANHVRAKMYESPPPFTQLTIIFDQVNFIGRHRPARAEAMAPAPPATVAGTGSHSQEDEVFARSLCKMLATRRQQNRLNTLVLIAPADFLAQILSHLSQDCLDVLAGCISESPAPMSEHDLGAYLRDLCPVTNC